MRIAVIGTGLMGASVALAARLRGDETVGWDIDPSALAVAVERGAVEAAPTLEDAARDVDLVVVAAPIAQLPAQVAAVLAVAGDATVTDVGSTKASVVAAAAGSPRFVGGHPISGAESRGAENASAGLFENATWFLPPGTHTDADRHPLVPATGPRPPPPRPRLRLRPRPHAGRDRPRRSRPARGDDEPRAARAREHRREPDRRGAARGARGAPSRPRG